MTQTILKALSKFTKTLIQLHLIIKNCWGEKNQELAINLQPWWILIDDSNDLVNNIVGGSERSAHKCTYTKAGLLPHTRLENQYWKDRKV